MHDTGHASESAHGEEGALVLALGRRIVRLREAKGWSRTDLAARLGVSRERLGNWERGRHAPPLGAQLALSRSLGISLDELVTGEAAAGREWSPKVRAEAEHHLAALWRLLNAENDGDQPGGAPEKEDQDDHHEA
jgi:transcriptional regulator with XRE-family HTH domain